jgi:acetyl-CoA carboxylase biotin carboxylase subunit
MNTRLQVEHPVTERVVGVDLVKEQINIANGNPLPFAQEDLRQHGHALQCRIYAEDPDNNFMPNPGTIKHITEPHGLGIRCDGYVYEGYEIPIYYDPMITKLISWGETRRESIARMKRALYEYKITGVKTNIKFLEKIMDTPGFIEGKYNTHFIEENNERLMRARLCGTECEDMAILAAFIDYIDKLERIQPPQYTDELGSNWKDFGRKRSVLRL